MMRRAGTSLEHTAKLTSKSYCLAKLPGGADSVNWPGATRPRSGSPERIDEHTALRRVD
jgi:hypothetical protein